jgi:hypothetical protein
MTAMEVVSTLIEVRAEPTRGGNARYVAKDADGREYTTFREEIGEHARRLAGRVVRITFHEERRSHYANVYLDEIALEPAHTAGAS